MRVEKVAGTDKWNGNLRHGVMVIKGQRADGTPLLAIPNYTRLNRNPTTATPDHGKSPQLYRMDKTIGRFYDAPTR